MDARAVADKYIANDGGQPEPAERVLRLTSNELRWLKTATMRGGWMPYRSHNQESGPTSRGYNLMQARGLVSGPPWRITKFGREAVKRAQLPKCNFVFEEQPPITFVKSVAVIRPLNEIEEEAVLTTLKHFKGKRARTAEALGISVRTLLNKLTRYRAALSRS